MSNEKFDDVFLKLQAGDRSALRVLFHQHHPMVCSVIHRFIQDHGTVEDLAQEVFVRFWEKREQIQINSSLQAYLRRMAINEALGYLRRNKHLHDEEVTPQLADSNYDGSAEEHYLHNELEHSIRAAIDTLPPKCRTVFQLSRFEEMTYQEIADQMGISIKTVENQMGKALRILREKLKGYLSIFL
ncbi:MAG: RNA polymerase sigma-70 factor [Saprospiraceae bacterium]|nr:RNA polymerase sigma-70 factor [Saprospiraceae bacterium]